MLSLSWVRHPSYAGFFYWALGTQLLLQNPLSLLFFCVVLWRFFYYRIRGWYLCFIKWPSVLTMDVRGRGCVDQVFRGGI